MSCFSSTLILAARCQVPHHCNKIMSKASHRLNQCYSMHAGSGTKLPLRQAPYGGASIATLWRSHTCRPQP